MNYSELENEGALRGDICNQNGSLWAYWILGKVAYKNQGPKSRNKKVRSKNRKRKLPVLLL